MHTRPEQIPRQSAPSSLSVTPQMYPFSSPTTAPLDSVVLAPVISVTIAAPMVLPYEDFPFNNFFFFFPISFKHQRCQRAVASVRVQAE